MRFAVMAIDPGKATGVARGLFWADTTIEVRETVEQALVSKTARVVEEVGLRNIGSDHVETVHEKIRRQQVEIERLGPDGKPLPAARA